jgi:hypothetical protein
MKIFITLLFLTITTCALAAPGELGLGLMVGNPTGVSGKYWLDDDHAVDGGVGVSLGEHSDLSLHSDYLFHSYSAFYMNDDIPLDFHYGVGGRMEFADEIELGLRVPVGLTHRFTETTADVFAEAAPILDFLGRRGIELHLVGGARYYF